MNTAKSIICFFFEDNLPKPTRGIRHGLNPFKNKTKKVIHYNSKEHTYWHILLKNIHVTDFYPLNCFDV